MHTSLLHFHGLQVAASHVFLLEPAEDPAIQQQAIARVDRIGQRRQVHVHMILVEDTVEVRAVHAVHAVLCCAA